MTAITRPGSSGDRRRSRTLPMVMPLYCTLDPDARPVTGCRKCTSSSCQASSAAHLADHRPTSTSKTMPARVKAPITTWLARGSISVCPSCLRQPGLACPRAVEVVLDPGMVKGLDLFETIVDQHAPVADDGNAIADT